MIISSGNSAVCCERRRWGVIVAGNFREPIAHRLTSHRVSFVELSTSLNSSARTWVRTHAYTRTHRHARAQFLLFDVWFQRFKVIQRRNARWFHEATSLQRASSSHRRIRYVNQPVRRVQCFTDPTGMILSRMILDAIIRGGCTAARPSNESSSGIFNEKSIRSIAFKFGVRARRASRNVYSFLYIEKVNGFSFRK